jgi:hypothetical protein
VVDVGEKTVADRVHFLELLVRGLKSFEHLAGEMRAAGRGHDIDRLVIESERLEAEEALAKARAKLTAGAAAAKARLKVAEKLRDQMHRLFTGGETNFDEYLFWQQRYNDTAREVMLLSGGNMKQLLENQLTAMNQLKQLVERSVDQGIVQQSAILKVEFYRLEIEEALARVQAESQIVGDKE